ncbi:Crp/Fnr family transcriptional regulator [Paraburkholderia sp. LEh10]|uniref:Crp/Fnr family transcriptional regulator n=1 Tax=Paraburkholderia sp. LEh10 TaxID=2821353 RepID=UPI001FD80490|nr:Crp/Fnr family transcriptional regulator [Paraburkholderia sp. LEh10]
MTDMSEAMRTNLWFSSLPPSAQEALIRRCETITLHAGEYLFRRGDLPNGFFGLKSGKLKAFTLREDGKEAILAVLEPGNWFGQTSMASRHPRLRDVAALERSSLFVVRNQAFDELMKSQVFFRAIAELQSIHMNWLYRMVEDATLYSTRARIARRLLLLASGDVTMLSQSRPDVTVSQDTLAMMLGITRQTLSVELKAMAEKGAIALRYGRIEICSVNILSSFQDCP